MVVGGWVGVGGGGAEAEGIVHMLKWHCAHAQLEACTCSTGSVHMLNWNMRMLKCKCAYAQLACTCSPESVRMLNWKHAHAQLEACTCLSGMCAC